jgi:hypothetical protein
MAATSSLQQRSLLIVSLIPMLLFGASCSGDGADTQPLGVGATAPISVGGGGPQMSWHPMATGTDELLWSVWGSPAGETVTVGTRATALHLEDGAWQEMPTNETGDLCDVWMSATGNALAVGLGGTVTEWDGTEWTHVNSGTSADLFSVWGFNNGYTIAVGDTGTILGFDGSEWSPMESGAGVSFFGVWGDSVSNTFAVGVGGTIMNFDGTAWSFMTTVTTENLSAVWGTSGADVWAVGDRGTILHYDGATWTGMASGTGSNLYAIFGTAADNVWAVGANGAITHYDGDGWSAVTAPIVTSLFGLWGRGPGDVYAVGEGGVILRYGLANEDVYACHDHPNGGAAPPIYGLRIDDLIEAGDYTFSFDYADKSGSAGVTLTYDADLRQIHIAGRAFGGLESGDVWVPGSSGWVDIDFTYTKNVSVRDACNDGEGDDLYVTGQSAQDAGTVALDGWGDDAVFQFSDKQADSGCSFIFDNDTDSKGNAVIAGDPAVWSGSGWLRPRESGSRDWLFIAEALEDPAP